MEDNLYSEVKHLLEISNHEPMNRMETFSNIATVKASYLFSITFYQVTVMSWSYSLNFALLKNNVNIVLKMIKWVH